MHIKAITLFSFSEDDAMAHLRILGPARDLGIDVIKGVENGKIHLDRIGQGDLVVIQREFPAEYQQFRSVINRAREENKPIVFELDDLLLDLPSQHPDKVRLHFTKALLPIVEAAALADLVTVSTEALKDYLSPLNENIITLPNFFDDGIWNFATPSHETRQKITIGYMGGHTHLYDIRSILNVILKLIEQYPDTIVFKFWGVKPPEELLTLPQVSWEIPNTLRYHDFADFFQKQSVDFFIAPLAANEFNRCKSPIKFFEYSALGAPGIFSDIDPFRKVIENKKNGFLAKTEEDWLSYTQLLIENPAERKQIALNAQESIRSRWLLSKNAHLWKEAYGSIPYVQRDDQRRMNLDRILHPINEDLELIHVTRSDAIEKVKDYPEQQRQMEALSAELFEIKISKTWKLALLFRQMRVKLFPADSLQFRLVRWVFQKYKENKVRGLLAKQLFANFRKRVKLEGTPEISVVMPIYDRTELLIESIESILRQSFKEFELLLICDGSPEETLEIVRSYEAKDKRVRAFYFKNNSGNACRGRNKGVKEAQGKYLAFQDSDDVAEPDRLKISLAAIEQYGVDVVYGGWRALVDGSRDIDIQNGQEVFSPDCDKEMLKKICVPCQSTVMVKVNAVRAVGGFKEKMRYREDHELWLRLAHNGYKFKSIQKILTNLRLHQNNLEITFKETDDHWFELMQHEYTQNVEMKPKIGYVIPGTGISGGIAVVCEHANRLLLRGYDVTLISEDNRDSIDWYPNLLAEVIPVKKMGTNYDILIATGWLTAYSVTQLPAKRRMYFVQSDESRFYAKSDPAYQRALKTYEMDFEFLTEAKWIRQWLRQSFEKDAVYIPNGLNERIIHKAEPIIPKADKVRVLLEGPIDIPFKGMADAFQAVKDLDCEVWCVSSAGKPKPEWKCDQFFYKVPIDKMKHIYSSCDILLKMSRVEGFFGPPLEMMACGGTVVVGKVTGYDEYIVDGYNALVVEMGDINGARIAVKRLIEDADLRRQLIQNGAKTADQWKWDSTIDTLERVYWPSDPTTIG